MGIAMETSKSRSKTSVLAVLAYLLAASFLCYEMALQVSPGVMTHDLMRDLGIDAGSIGFIASAYFFSYTIMQIPVGLLFDRYSSRLLITVAVMVCASGAVFFGMTHSMYFAALGRFFMGFGSAFAFIGVLVVAATWFAPRFFALLVGIAQCLAAMGAYMGAGPFATAVENFGWRSVVHVLALTGFSLMALSWFLIRDKKPDVSLQQSKSSMSIIDSVQAITREAQTWWVAVYAFACWAPMTAFPATWGVAYLMQRYAISRSVAAHAVGMIWIGLAVTAPFIGWLSDNIGRRNILLQTCAFVGVVSSMTILYAPHLSLVAVYCLLFSFGIATAGQIISFAVIKDNNRAEVTATAIGFNNMAVVAGGAIFPYLVGRMLTAHWDGSVLSGTPVYSVHNYQFSLSVVPICFAITWIASLFFIKETYCKQKFS